MLTAAAELAHDHGGFRGTTRYQTAAAPLLLVMSLAFTTDGRLRRGFRPLAVPAAYTAFVLTASTVHPVERAARRADRAYRIALRTREAHSSSRGIDR